MKIEHRFFSHFISLSICMWRSLFVDIIFLLVSLFLLWIQQILILILILLLSHSLCCMLLYECVCVCGVFLLVYFISFHFFHSSFRMSLNWIQFNLYVGWHFIRIRNAKAHDIKHDVWIKLAYGSCTGIRNALKMRYRKITKQQQPRRQQQLQHTKKCKWLLCLT